MNGSPTKKQKDWHQWLIKHGCSVTGFLSSPVSLHHIKGSKMKLKGCDKPGEWYCICLSHLWHQDGKNPAARHVNKKLFETETGRTEKQMFIFKVKMYEAEHGHKPMSEDEYQIIVERA